MGGRSGNERGGGQERGGGHARTTLVMGAEPEMDGSLSVQPALIVFPAGGCLGDTHSGSTMLWVCVWGGRGHVQCLCGEEEEEEDR